MYPSGPFEAWLTEGTPQPLPGTPRKAAAERLWPRRQVLALPPCPLLVTHLGKPQPRPGTLRHRRQGTPASRNGGTSNSLCVSCLGAAPSRPTRDRQPMGSPEPAQPARAPLGSRPPGSAREHWPSSPPRKPRTRSEHRRPTGQSTYARVFL